MEPVPPFWDGLFCPPLGPAGAPESAASGRPGSAGGRDSARRPALPPPSPVLTLPPVLSHFQSLSQARIWSRGVWLGAGVVDITVTRMRTAKDGVITILYNIAHIAQECFEELHNIVQYCVHCWHIYCTNIAQYCAICVQYCVILDVRLCNSHTKRKLYIIMSNFRAIRQIVFILHVKLVVLHENNL